MTDSSEASPPDPGPTPEPDPSSPDAGSADSTSPPEPTEDTQAPPPKADEPPPPKADEPPPPKADEPPPPKADEPPPPKADEPPPPKADKPPPPKADEPPPPKADEPPPPKADEPPPPKADEPPPPKADEATAPSPEPASPERTEDPPAPAPSGLQRFFLVERVFAVLLTLSLVFGGLFAYSSMPKESNPSIELPRATVRVPCPGFSAEEVEKQVTDRLEEEIKTIKGLKKLQSASQENQAVLSVEFRTDLEAATSMARLRAKVAEAEAKLPQGVVKPSVVQTTVDDRAILAVTLAGPLNPRLMGRVAKRLQKRLERIRGVREVNLAGQRDEQVVVRLIRSRMDAIGLSATQVRDALVQANKDSSWQRFEGVDFNLPFRLRGRLRRLEAFQSVPVARVGDRVIELREVAEVRRTLEKERVRTQISTDGGEYAPCIDLAIIKSAGADTVRTIEAVKAEIALARAESTWPHTLTPTYTTDQSVSIWADLKSVFNNGWQAMLGVFLVLLVFLSWREAICASLTIPITLLGALLIVWFLGYTMNKLVIIGMVLSLGLLVDMFILMMEGMHEGIYVRKESFATAALATVRTYARPAFAGQLTTVLAMAPLMAIAGFQGKFIRVIPATAIACLAVSFTAALLILIPLSSFLLAKANRDAPPLKIDRLAKSLSSKLYDWLKPTVLRSRWTAGAWLLAGGVLFLGSGKLFGYLPSELYPPSDNRDLALSITLEPHATLGESQAVADAVGEVLRKKPYFETTVKFVGQLSPLSQGTPLATLAAYQKPHLAGFSTRLLPRDQRDEDSLAVVGELRDDLAPVLRRFPGSKLRLVYTGGAGTTDDGVQIVLFGDDLERLRASAQDVKALLRKTRGSLNVRDNLGPLEAQIAAHPRREAMTFHQLTDAELGEQIALAMSPQKVGEFIVPGVEENLAITVSTAWESRRGLIGGPMTVSEGKRLRVTRPDGRSIPLAAVTVSALETEPLVINRHGGRRAVTISCKAQDATVGEVLARVKPGLEELKSTWPAGYGYRFGGEAEDAAETFGSAAAMLVVAVFLVVGLLIIQFNSFGQPFIILLVIPLALIGTFTGFFLFGFAFSFPAMIGVISLIGIVVNTSIVMVDTINGYRAAGMDLQEAIARGSSDRLRPIVATTLTTLVGLVPLALSAPEWTPLCASIIFGLVAATAFAFVMIPAAYLVFTGDDRSVQ